MIINLDSECIWKEINVYCTKLPYHHTGMYPEGSINNKYYVTTCCATLQFWTKHSSARWLSMSRWSPVDLALFFFNTFLPKPWWVPMSQRPAGAQGSLDQIFLYLNWRTRKEQKTLWLCVKLHLKRSCWLVFAALVIRVLVKSLLITLFYQFVFFSLTLFTTTSCFQSHSPVSNSIMMIRPTLMCLH